jgi:hypothetical protein
VRASAVAPQSEHRPDLADGAVARADGVSADKLTRPQRYLERGNMAGCPFLLETASALTASALTGSVPTNRHDLSVISNAETWQAAHFFSKRHQ